MNRFNRGVVVSILPVLAALVPLHAQDQPKKQTLEGIWLGPLKIPGSEVRIAFHVTAKDGKLTATMDSLDQGAKGIPVAKVVFKDSSVRFDVEIAKVVYEGKLNKDGTEIAGEWKQGSAAVPLMLKRVDKLPMLARPQEPKPPFPYREEEVVYENKKANVKLAGTLTLPKGNGPFPAVLLITGSGAQDRNSELFSHKPFLVIADHFTRRGIAVLRVDDRGVGGSTGNMSISTCTSADFAVDVLTGIEFLKAHKEIDPKRIGLAGHSEGGIIAPMVAAESRDVAFIIMLAGCGVPGDEVLLLQNKLLMSTNGATKDDIDVQLKLLTLIMAVAKKEGDVKVADKRIREEFAKWKATASDEEKKLLDEREREDLDAIIIGLTTSWFRYFLSHDPRPSLRKVQCPVLALIGTKDLQVPYQQNLPEITKALKDGGNNDFTIKEMPNLNHLFQTCKTGAASEYGNIEETMAPAVLELMADWILARVKK